jgi:type II secretory pathway pseudopilin PulG
MFTSTRQSRSGFTLLEILTVMLGLGMVLMLTSIVLAGTLRLQKASQLSLERTSARSALADQFRADVARSQASPASLGDFKAGDRCLLLRDNGATIVYRCQAQSIERLELAADGMVLRSARLGPQEMGARFSRRGSEGRSITLSLGQNSNRPGHPWIIQATLGGDWQ